MSTSIGCLNILVQRVALMLALLVLYSCSAPNKESIAEDFRQIFAKEGGAGALPVVLSVHVGEGDADNVYEHIKFDVLAMEDVSFKNGWLAGMSLGKGKKLHDGEVVVLYQRKNGSRWVITNYQLTRKPSERREILSDKVLRSEDTEVY